MCIGAVCELGKFSTVLGPSIANRDAMIHVVIICQTNAQKLGTDDTRVLHRIGASTNHIVPHGKVMGVQAAP